MEEKKSNNLELERRLINLESQIYDMEKKNSSRNFCIGISFFLLGGAVFATGGQSFYLVGLVSLILAIWFGCDLPLDKSRRIKTKYPEDKSKQHSKNKEKEKRVTRAGRLPDWVGSNKDDE